MNSAETPQDTRHISDYLSAPEKYIGQPIDPQHRLEARKYQARRTVARFDTTREFLAGHAESTPLNGEERDILQAEQDEAAEAHTRLDMTEAEKRLYDENHPQAQDQPPDNS